LGLLEINFFIFEHFFENIFVFLIPRFKIFQKFSIGNFLAGAGSSLELGKLECRVLMVDLFHIFERVSIFLHTFPNFFELFLITLYLFGEVLKSLAQLS